MLYRQGPWSFGRVPLVLTFQMEVAERLCSPVDTPFRARISIMSTFITEPKLLFQIPGICLLNTMLLLFEFVKINSFECVFFFFHFL